MVSTDIAVINSQLCTLSISEALSFLSNKFEGEVTFSTSFGAEDQVISHLIFTENIPIKVFTLDTGRIFKETYKTHNATIERYKKPIQVYFPEFKKLEAFLTQNGPNSFYESVENRKKCCKIRKVLPLKRALKGNKIWITGLRAEQSMARNDLQLVEWDENLKIIKYNPLFDWTLDMVWDFIKNNNIPYNILHDKGFVSIGCEPCTRAIHEGEDFRAGRWWWEQGSKKECGLHVSK